MANMSPSIETIIATAPTPQLKAIAQQVKDGQRIDNEACLLLFEQGSLGFVGSLANYIREQKTRA